jgi:hypothetical protein
MIIKTGVTVYQCQYCKRKMFRKHAMEHHEKYCYANPVNWKACSNCVHLEETTIEVNRYSYHEHNYISKRKTFRCKKLNQLMYPTIVERRGYLTKFPETFENQIAMPRECEHLDDGLNF